MAVLKHHIDPKRFPAPSALGSSSEFLGKRDAIEPFFPVKNSAKEALPAEKLINKKKPDEPKRDSADLVSKGITKMTKKLKTHPN